MLFPGALNFGCGEEGREDGFFFPFLIRHIRRKSSAQMRVQYTTRSHTTRRSVQLHRAGCECTCTERRGRESSLLIRAPGRDVLHKRTSGHSVQVHLDRAQYELELNKCWWEHRMSCTEKEEKNTVSTASFRSKCTRVEQLVIWGSCCNTST